jgi:hypothetical protein
MAHLRYHFITSLTFFATQCLGQKADSAIAPKLKFSGYVDAYYAYYTDDVGTGNFQKFPAISPRSNSFGLNIAQVSEQFTSDRIRSTATLQYGDLPTAAWSPVFNYIQEANVGVRLAKNFWLDAGFFKTHIGTEQLLPKDNIASSVSMITFYEPWWQSGIRLSYDISDRLQTALFVENGYNQFVASTNKKALGFLITYALGTKGNIGYYSFLGDVSPDYSSVSKVRFLNNLVFTYAFCEKFNIVLGVDLISQQNSNLADETKNAYVYSSICTLNYKFINKFRIYYRVATFNDANGILTGIILNTDNQETGYIEGEMTLGMEYKPTENSYIRLEGRGIQMDPTQQIFLTNGNATNYRDEVMVNMGIWF